MSIAIQGDVLAVEVDSASESTSMLFARWMRIGALCREHGLARILYLRSGPPTPRLVVAEAVRALPSFGLSGCRIAVLLPDSEEAYPLLFLERLAAEGGISMLVCHCRAQADEFLRSGARTTACSDTDPWFDCDQDRVA